MKNYLIYTSSLNSIGRLYYTKGKFLEAQQFFFKALNILKSNLGEFMQKKLSKNYNHYKKKKKRMNNKIITHKLFQQTNQLQKSDIHKLQLISELFFYLQANNDKALQFLQMSLQISNKQQYSPLQAGVLQNLELIYNSKGQCKKALQNFTKAAQIYKSLVTEKHPVYAKVLGNIRITYMNLNQYDKALNFSIKASQIYKAVLGSEHPDYTGQINNIASIYISKRKYDEALQYFLESYEIYKKLNNIPLCGKILDNIGNGYYGKRDYEVALDCYKRVSQMLKQSVSQNSIDYTRNLDHFGQHIVSQSYMSNQCKTYQRLYKLIKLQQDKITQIMQEPQTIQEKFNMQRKTINKLQNKYYHSSARIFQQIKQKNNSHPEYGLLLINIGKIEKDNNNLQLSLDYFKKLLNCQSLAWDQIIVTMQILQIYRSLLSLKQIILISTKIFLEH